MKMRLRIVYRTSGIGKWYWMGNTAKVWVVGDEDGGESLLINLAVLV